MATTLIPATKTASTGKFTTRGGEDFTCYLDRTGNPVYWVNQDSTSYGRDFYATECGVSLMGLAEEVENLILTGLPSVIEAYGVTPEDFDRKFEEQNGLCAICQQPMIGKRKACQDHNHVSGKNRDILCSSCNCLIGYSYENKEILLSAIQYLEKHANDSSTQIVHVDSSERSSVLSESVL